MQTSSVSSGKCLVGHFNIPKLHGLLHYLFGITRIGTLDNCNTEATERNHIEYAKTPYAGTNRKEFLEQMIIWLIRHEKMKAFEIRLQWQQGLMPAPRPRRRRTQFIKVGMQLAKNPSATSVSFAKLATDYGALHFEEAVNRFISDYKDPPKDNRRRRISFYSVPFNAVDVWHRVKFGVPNLQVLDASATLQSVHVEPKRDGEVSGRVLPARFDTVIVNESPESEEIGMAGELFLSFIAPLQS